MKAKFLFAGVAMVAALASCSKENSSTPEVGTFDATKAYAKLDIHLGGVGTRALNGGFDAGIEAERKVKTVALVVYDENGAVVGYGSTNISKDEFSEGTVNISDTYDNVVELEMIGDKNTAKTVVAYVNVPLNDVRDLALSDGTSQKTYKASEISTTDNFYMSNAGYFENSKWKVAEPITPGSIYGTEEAANQGKDATTIYVERLAAKVSVSLEPNAPTTVEGITITNYDRDQKYTLKFNADQANWAASGTAQEMFLLKNPWEREVTLDAWANKNTETNFRSYWAAGKYYEGSYEGMQNNLDYTSYNDITNGALTFGEDVTYIPEHTYGKEVLTSDYTAVGAATGVMALGQYQVLKKDDSEPCDDYNDDSRNPDFYLLLTKKAEQEGVDDEYTIFRAEELMQYLFENTAKDFYASASEDEKISKEDVSEYFNLKWTGKQYTLVAKNDIYVQGEEEKEKYEGPFAASNARHYNLGKAYFFTPIEHNGGEILEEGTVGVVRNHFYTLNVTSITGLGTPLDDDHFGEDGESDKPIVPDPETVALLKAEIKVLSWFKVSQDVEW